MLHVKKEYFVLLIFFGCSSAPKILPKNEINEPIFHKTNFAALGTSLGKSWSWFDPRWNFLSNQRYTHQDDIYVNPAIEYDRNENAWATYTLLPVFWNLLWTGEQYADSSNLKIKKLDLAFHGGISGLSYSQASGWVTSGLLAISGKYLFNNHLFATSILGVDAGDLDRIENTVDEAELQFGWQTTERNSISLDYHIWHFNYPRFDMIQDQGIYYRDADSRSQWMLRDLFYFKRKNVFGPEAMFIYKNYDVLRNHCIELGFHYEYRFD